MKKYYINNQLLSNYETVKRYKELVSLGERPNLRAVIRRMLPGEVLECVPDLAEYGITVDIPRYLRRLDGYRVFLNEQYYRDLFTTYGSKSNSARNRFEKAIDINRLVRLMFNEHRGYNEAELNKVLAHPELNMQHFCRYIDGFVACKFSDILIKHGASRDLVKRAANNCFEYDY